MSSPEQPPDDLNDSAFTIRLTRDSLILIAAVGFLGVAILLAALFGGPASTPTAAQPTSPATSGRATALLGTPLATLPPPTPAIDSSAPTAALIPTITTPPEPTVLAQLPSPTPPGAVPGGAYPGPAVNGPATATAPLPTSAASTSAPVFAPTVIPATLGPAAQAPPTAPIPPTLAPTIAAPTIPPPTIAAPTIPPPTRSAPAPQQPPAATRAPRATAVPQPTVPPVTILRGTTYWRADQGPYQITRNVAVAAGGALIIEPGTEVRLAPGVSISADGKIYAVGKPGQPVRFVGSSPQRWDGLYGRPGSEIVLEQAEIRGGGVGGTLIASERGTLALRGVKVTDNGGHIQSTGSSLEVRDSEISGNDMPYGAAIDASFSGGTATVVGNRIGGNRMEPGAPTVRLRNTSAFDGLSLDVRGNLLVGMGRDGPNLTLETGPTVLRGEVACNALLNGANGLSVRADVPQVPGLPLSVHDNAIDDHIPPVVPVYLKYGIGRGATSTVGLDMGRNWWGSDLGPYEPDRHADGRGDSVGENIRYEPWLSAWPSCAPHP